MIDVSSEGRTVLLSSHQVAEVERVADIVVILLNGRLLCVERLEDLRRDTLEVVLSLTAADSVVPEMPKGNVLAHIAFGHEHVWMVRNPDIDQLAETCHRQNLPEAQIRKPNLEDILLAMLREYRRGRLVRKQQLPRQSRPLKTDRDSTCRCVNRVGHWIAGAALRSFRPAFCGS